MPLPPFNILTLFFTTSRWLHRIWDRPYLDLFDKYTISHIKIIKFFNNPTHFAKASNSPYMVGSPTTVLFQAFPELDNVLFKKVYKDLYIDGMVTTENLNITVTGSAMVAKRTTELGDDFLRFILGSATK